jgi:hypothetical protein
LITSITTPSNTGMYRGLRSGRTPRFIDLCGGEYIRRIGRAVRVVWREGLVNKVGGVAWGPGFRKRRSTHIWSPPVLQDSVRPMTGTGLLPYIRPVDEEQAPLALMRSARIVLIRLPAFNSLWVEQGFNTRVLPVCHHAHIVFAIVGRFTS